MNKPIYDGPPGGDFKGDEVEMPEMWDFAFPQSTVCGNKSLQQGGMTLRAYMATEFAGALLSCGHEGSKIAFEAPAMCAKWAVEFADMLIEELAK